MEKEMLVKKLDDYIDTVVDVVITVGDEFTTNELETEIINSPLSAEFIITPATRESFKDVVHIMILLIKEYINEGIKPDEMKSRMKKIMRDSILS